MVHFTSRAVSPWKEEGPRSHDSARPTEAVPHAGDYMQLPAAGSPRVPCCPAKYRDWKTCERSAQREKRGAGGVQCAIHHDLRVRGSPTTPSPPGSQRMAACSVFTEDDFIIRPSSSKFPAIPCVVAVFRKAPA